MHCESPKLPLLFKKSQQTIIYIDNLMTWQLPALIRCEMEGFQLFTPMSHPESCLPRPLVLIDWCYYIDTLTLTIARQDPRWHGNFSTFYSMVTPRQLPTKTLRRAVISTLWPWQLPPKICSEKEGFQLFIPWSHKNRVQWVFLLSCTKYSSDLPWPPHEYYTLLATLQVS